MKKNLPSLIQVCMCLFSLVSRAQVPVANFTISPNPVCSGNVIQITDLSTGNPTSWTYTMGGFGPNGTTLTVQNPTLALNAAGVYSITLIATNGSGASVPVTQTFQVLASPIVQINPQNQNTCLGGAITTVSVLTPGPGGTSNTFSWSTGATTATLAVTPTVTTIYTCVVTSTNGCFSTRMATINITTPTASITSNPVMLCPGSLATLIATGQQPGPFTYSWTPSANTRSIATNSAGVYDVTVTNGNGCTASVSYTLGTSTTLSMNATANPTLVCTGNTATLSGQGASTYSWSNGATTPNMTVSPGGATTFTVYGQLGTCTGSATIFLPVSFAPTLVATSNPVSMCAGGSATLTATGAVTYTWLPNIVSSVTVVSPQSSTTYTVRGTNPGCPARGTTVNVVVLPSPAVNIAGSATTIVCAGESIALAASGALNYAWNTGATVAVILVSPAVTTTYSVLGTSANGCTATAAMTQSVSDCSAILERSQFGGISLFPNPSKGDFKISTTDDADIMIADLNGKVVTSVYLRSDNERTLHVNGINPGIYFIVVNANGKVTREKLVVIE
jgi:PKD repeat protein